MNGILLVNKPKGVTSRDVVDDVCRVLGTSKVGHTGTLDPLATGVLVITIGRATKLNLELTSTEKEYIAEVTLGISTDTLDITGNILEKKDFIITKEEVEKYSTKLIAEDNFEFCDAIIKKDYKKIQECLNDFINLKCEISPFISLLAGQFRIIYAIKNMEGSNDTIAEAIKVHPYRVKLARENALRYTKDEIQKILLDLCDLDYNIKTSNIDKYILFKIFIVNI